MADSEIPDSSERQQSGGEPTAAELVSLVMSWHIREIVAERRAPNPDLERLEHLLAGQQECAQDEVRLGEADAEELARIAASYAVRLKEIEATGS